MDALLKWPGGKRRLASRFAEEMQQYIAPGGRFIELFAGSAAVCFAMEPEKAVLVDSCKPLVSFYEAIQREPGAVFDEIRKLLDLPFGKETYESVKAKWNGHDFGVRFAARFLYLNKLCFNGLFRLNSRLGFNAAWGKKAKLPAFPTADELVAASDLLRRAKLYCNDFSLILRKARKGDVVYADPPYWGTFDCYAGGSFDQSDHSRLARDLRRASYRGVTVFASNVDCEEIRALYGDWSEIEEVPVQHVIGASAKSRRRVTELLISSCARVKEESRQLELFGDFLGAG